MKVFVILAVTGLSTGEFRFAAQGTQVAAWFKTNAPTSDNKILHPPTLSRSPRQIFRRGRKGRQNLDENQSVGVDFSGCVEDPDTGNCCVDKIEKIKTIKKEPILECIHKNREQCHYTYVTQFTPTQEEFCEENFEKKCAITYKKQAYNETVQKCYIPIEKVCNGQGPEECHTQYESSCTTKYVEKSPGKFVGDTKCEKIPVEICGAGCTFEQGEKECHDKILTSTADLPEEICDLSPQKICRFKTKLVPRLVPKHECTIVPSEVCQLRFTTGQEVEEDFLTRWCLDPTEPAPGEDYEEAEALADPIGPNGGGRRRVGRRGRSRGNRG